MCLRHRRGDGLVIQEYGETAAVQHVAEMYDALVTAEELPVKVEYFCCTSSSFFEKKTL
jgi:hypothetical protein